MHYHENNNNVSTLKRLYSFGTMSHQFDDETYVFDADEVLIQQVLSHYTDTLHASQRAIHFLAKRGLNHADAIEYFSLGFANRTLGLKLRALGRTQEELARGALQRIGLLKPSGHEFFRGALLFPCFDEDGKVTGGYGRRITPKLKAYSVYHVHWTSETMTFFNLKALQQYKKVILCKSPVDALTLWCLGFKHVIATIGIMGFGKRHLDKLKQHDVHTVIIAIGNTDSGHQVANVIEKRLHHARIMSARLALPKDMDVNQCALHVSDPKRLFTDLLQDKTLH